MAVVSLNHANRRAHLHRKRMYIHAVVEQRKGRVGVTQTIQRAVLVRARTCDQPCVCEELAECLVDVF